MAEEDTPRYDLLVVPPHRAMNVADKGAAQLIQVIAIGKQAIPYEEAVAQQWVEVYMRSGPSSHELFTKGAYSGPEPVFHDAVLRWGKRPESLDYGVDTDRVRFFLEFRGCVFDSLAGPFQKKLQDMLFFKPQVFTRPFRSLPPHKEVPEGEEPSDDRLKPTDHGVGLAGTRVEEF